MSSAVGKRVFVALTGYDYEGDAFEGVFSTIALAKNYFPGGSKRKWRYDPKTLTWSRRPTSMKTYTIQAVSVK